MTSLLRTAPRSQRVPGDLIRVGDVHVRVNVTGEGPPVLLVHGLGASLDLWEPLVKQLEGYTVITLDNPGAGASTVPWPAWRMSKYAETVDAVLEELGYDTVDVVGLSFGGMVCQEFAHKYPHRIRRLVLAATAAGMGAVFGNPLALSVLMTPLRYYSRSYMAAVAPFLYGGDADGESELVQRQSDLRHKMRPSIPGYFAQLATASTFSSVWYLNKITVPTLVVAGGDDPITNPFTCKVIAQLIPDAEYVELEGAGHLFLMERPTQSAALLRDWFERTPRETPVQQVPRPVPSSRPRRASA
ncbi:alpha/beta fold hydrolase [Cumulibacter manganitolerans]|uniref:alpha/beta fold hydrolase n=1 Tax=Cumulibacter manganitolerans TaxID=1884992 RepID=UPI0012969EFC|nr:alpha/beta hydrolase [Cumulibacter manganitolerans]